ncbi:hotdog fold thioesterase [Pedobacter nutrimenti]|uniref:1,4-dihydroxy-2-naphthoyl-CoA hydrolase n=1 Tax=Pedobacter nutrimenti TaxID=1241337 RepID=A0A318UH07_9SPHI|nr:hotdog fold thioesterase [Pedobacter nutrimenti]PYF75744.1 1,4-dihydroxy-2-naphthoyl-CoA hydrolase [Pedobacter nutrimenti]
MPKNHIGALLDIQFTEVGEDFMKATMPVDQRTHQPFGILHGGASVVLAESLGSMASFMCIDSEKYMAVGLEVNANHLRPVKSGLVTGVCKPLHLGSKTHVWEIKIYTDKGKMSCISRLTVAIIPKPQ